jgi:hypothetical protein
MLLGITGVDKHSVDLPGADKLDEALHGFIALLRPRVCACATRAAHYTVGQC